MTYSTLRLISGYKALESVFNSGFNYAPLHIRNSRPYGNSENATLHDYEIEGYGNGQCILEDGKLIIQSFSNGTIAYTNFYGSRHGNKELIAFLGPLLESRILPELLSRDK